MLASAGFSGDEGLERKRAPRADYGNAWYIG